MKGNAAKCTSDSRFGHCAYSDHESNTALSRRELDIERMG